MVRGRPGGAGYGPHRAGPCLGFVVMVPGNHRQVLRRGVM